ncbi:hypothetical protein Pcinc_022345 [Petrolisthes cinctipes]|uniref:Uncharacterized protein n=1 Tax=Petrolisthes cinctipes TaxID=88211 RepID=A0AAE1KDU8_PETCI|nr:hypothetical protein Pcinc_022345 [Petrolisthes cinctipes]
MTEVRRGSVTELLQGAANLYSPPSPRYIPIPHPDCWNDTKGLRQEREKLVASSRLSRPALPLHSINPDQPSSPNKPNPTNCLHNLDQPHSLSPSLGTKGVPASRQHELDVPKLNTTPKKPTEGMEGKEGKERTEKSTKPGVSSSRAKPSTLKPGKHEVAKGSSGGDKTVTPALRGTKMGRGGGGVQNKESGATHNNNDFSTDQVNVPSKPHFRVMAGCSGAYQQAVREVRGSTPDTSVVVLGVLDNNNTNTGSTTTSQQPNKASPHFNTRTFTVAIAAAKMRSLGLRRSGTAKVSCAGPDPLPEPPKDNTGSDQMHTPDSSLLAVQRKPESTRPRGSKKVFEDAYVVTWSQSVLPADQSDFNITFNKPRKNRVVRVGKLRRRSTHTSSSNIIPTQDKEDKQDREAAEWLEWRRTHDRVLEWLRSNAQVEADESHVISMLLDPDPKKGGLFRT